MIATENSLAHTRWECKYQMGIIFKYWLFQSLFMFASLGPSASRPSGVISSQSWSFMDGEQLWDIYPKQACTPH